MKIIQKVMMGTVFALIAAVPVFLVASVGQANAANEPAKPVAEQKAEKTYNYVAQSGDSFSLMARKAVQTYGIDNKVNLTPSQIIFAETMATQQAGSPSLTLGQKVEIKQSTIKNWVEKAQKLNDSQKKAWAVYAVGVNFNTNNVGQAKK